jgi:CheY-like chemotaxis protein
LNLNTVVAEDVAMLRHLLGDHIDLITDLDPSLGLVSADLDQIHQVILNLVVNARDAMAKGGKLIIALSNVVVGEAHVAGTYEVKAGPYVQLIVADTGTGMTDEVRAHLFEPFFTTKEKGKGTGLGLSSVYGIIHQNGGHIVVESEALKGTTFQILLPRVEGLPEPDTPAKPVVRGGHETILLVEDQQQVRTLLVSFLQRMGYRVFDAASGEEAMQLVDQYGTRLELLITDVAMPGMSGHQLAQSVRARHPAVKVLVMSGYDDDTADIPDILRDPLSAYLQKSFAPETLAVKVREILDRQ